LPHRRLAQAGHHLLGLLLAASATVAFGWQASTPQALPLQNSPPLLIGDPPPAVRFVVPPGGQPIELQQYRQEVQVVGRSVQTRLTLQLHNPNPRVLEGELQLPLAPGQTVTGLALDIAGELRRAVPVPRAKGLQVFEDTVRSQVDPALLEAGPGNLYKLRVYPLPAQGSRRVVLDLAQALPGDAAAQLTLPLGLDLPARNAEFSLQLAGVPPSALRWQLRGLPAAAVAASARSDGSSVLQMAGLPLAGPALLSLQWRPPEASSVQTAHFDGQDFVYAELPAPTTRRPRPAPRRLALVWDASGSAAQRNIPAELAVLGALFAHWQHVQVTLHVLRDRLEPAQAFAVRGGDWQALRERLQAEPFDGATQLGALQLPAGSADLALVFSDGQGNFGPGRLPAFGLPTYVLQSSLAAEPAALRALAEAQGGELIDLLHTRPAQALRQVTQEAPRLVALRSDQGQHWVAERRRAGAGHLAVAGLANAPHGTLEAVFALPGGGQLVQRVGWRLAAVPAPASTQDRAEPASIESRARLAGAEGPPLPAWRWARLKLDELALRPELHRAEIERLGQRFGLATAETSLIVLDTLADYVLHGIEPPAGPLRHAWQLQRSSAQAAAQQQQQVHLEQLLRRWREREAWWATDFPKSAPPDVRREAKQAGALGEELASRHQGTADRKSTRLNSSHRYISRMPSSA
jgi:hypothetical protein